MRCRRKKDRDIVDRCDLTEEGLGKWIDELFAGEVMDSSVLEWGKQVMMTNYVEAKDKKIKQLMLWKVIHTREVVEAGKDIFGDLGEKRLVEIVCFLHDIGRFKQAHLGGYADEVVMFDHATREQR